MFRSFLGFGQWISSKTIFIMKYREDSMKDSLEKKGEFRRFVHQLFVDSVNWLAHIASVKRLLFHFPFHRQQTNVWRCCVFCARSAARDSLIRPRATLVNTNEKRINEWQDLLTSGASLRRLSFFRNDLALTWMDFRSNLFFSPSPFSFVPAIDNLQFCTSDFSTQGWN